MLAAEKVCFFTECLPLVFKEMSERKFVLKLPMFVKKIAADANDPAVDQRAEDGSELYALKMPHSKEGKGEQNAQKTADTIISRFEFVNVDFHALRNLLDKELIRLG